MGGIFVSGCIGTDSSVSEFIIYCIIIVECLLSVENSCKTRQGFLGPEIKLPVVILTTDHAAVPARPISIEYKIIQQPPTLKKIIFLL